MEITREIKVVFGDNRGSFPFCNGLAVDDEIRVLIDAGGGRPLRAAAIEPDVVLLSHYHLDHTRDAAALNRPLYCHPADIPPLEKEGVLLEYTGFRELGDLRAGMILEFLQHRPLAAAGSFADGDLLDFGKTKFRVLHTPGHSPGHCCFYEERQGILFSADIDLTAFGPWYGHNSCDLDAFEESIRRVMALKPSIIISGHSEPLREAGEAALKTYLEVIAGRDRRILDFLARPATLEEVADQRFIYGHHPEPAFLYRHFEKKMIKRHLDRLYTRGRVQVEGGVYLKVSGRQKFFGSGGD
jgi:glyoxylase-like metal-dependent hydrolase (beta-lactamase superfamily II)